MYDSTTTVTVGLDVHARSIRLAAVRADELLEERTLPYDEEAVERVLRRWPSVRCCYEAGPTGFGLQRHLVERGIDCQVVAPGLVPQRPGDRVKTDPVTRASSLVCWPVGCWSRSMCPRASWRRPVIWCVRVRTRALIGCATGIGCRSSACVTGACCRLAPGRSCGASGSPSSGSSSQPQQIPSIPTCTRSTSSTRGSSSWSARSARPPSRSRGGSSSLGCAACAGSTR